MKGYGQKQNKTHNSEKTPQSGGCDWCRFC